MNKPIKAYSIDELKIVIKELGQPSFRAAQLTDWIYARNVRNYDDMTNLPKSLRIELTEKFPLYSPHILDTQISRDETRKFVVAYHDEACVETISLPSPDGRLTVCCSTQSGCPMDCAFCATGRAGFTRNLTAGEIVDQVLLVQEQTGQRVSNIVAMGQGEPFLNYDQALEALRICNNKNLLNIGARHITISTCGIIPGIERFSYEPEQFTLAVSLHAAQQAVRDHLMPSISHYSLNQLKRALQQYGDRTNRRVTLEYAMIDKTNDSKDDLRALIDFCGGLLCHINLIPLNTIEESSFKPSAPFIVKQWFNTLHQHGIETTIRNSRGSDIAGACGQLKNAMNP